MHDNLSINKVFQADRYSACKLRVGFLQEKKIK